MVPFLIDNVAFDSINMPGANRESAISVLPVKIGLDVWLLFHPSR